MLHKKLINVKWILSFVLFVTVALIVTKTVNMEIPVETGIIGTMFTFFYGLFINSMFRFLDEKYMNFRIYLGDLIGMSQALYNHALLTKDKDYIAKMREELSGFIESFSKIKATRYYLNQYRINRLYVATKELNLKSEKNKTEYSRTLSLIDSLSTTREKLEIFGSKQLTKDTRLIFIVTTTIYIVVIAFLTFTNMSLYMTITGILLIVMVIFVTLMMFDLDDLSHSTYYIKDKNLEELVDMFEGKEQTEADNKKPEHHNIF
jgi:ABC-type multidrug transport system fused ATPase/permease subunit